MIQKRKLVTYLVSGLLIGVTLACGGGGVSVAPLSNDIAFVSRRDGNEEIYTVKPDGTSMKRLTNNSARDAHPQWSPDGKSIIFQSDRSGKSQIYKMDENGGSLVRLTTNSTADYMPCYSPDGTKIVFARDDFSQGPNVDIYVMNSDGSGQVNLTANILAYDWFPRWSPDGSKILFSSNRDDTSWGDLFVMDANGANVKKLLTRSGLEDRATWSPNGSEIIFQTSDSQILKMNADGSNVIQLTSTNHRSGDPEWSPDGTQIVFNTNLNATGTSFHLNTMNKDGSSIKRLTSDTSTEMYPAWRR